MPLSALFVVAIAVVCTFYLVVLPQPSGGPAVAVVVAIAVVVAFAVARPRLFSTLERSRRGSELAFTSSSSTRFFEKVGIVTLPDQLKWR